MKSCIISLMLSAAALAIAASAQAQGVAPAPGPGAASAQAEGKDPPGVNPIHYQCYKVEAPTKPITVNTLRDQFGAAEKIAVTTPMYLCVPTARTVSSRRI